jgi:NTE family protein
LKRENLLTDIIEELRRIELLAEMDSQILVQIAAVVVIQNIEPGEALVEENSLGEDLYFVRSGSFLVTLMDGETSIEVARLGEGDVIGETQLICGGRRTATVRAHNRCEVLCLPRAELDELVLANEPLRDAIASIIHHRLRESALRLALPHAVGTDPELLDLLSSAADWVRMERGETLWEQGDTADSWYVLVSGELAATRTEHGVDRQIGTVRRGEVLGELALIHKETRSAAIRATRESWLARFDKRLLDEEILTRHSALKALVMTFADRLSTGTQANRLTSPVITIVSRDPNLDTDLFVRELAAALGPGGIIVDPEVLRKDGVVGDAEQVPVEHPAWLRFEAWVETQREKMRYILLVTNGDDNPWTRTAVERAETVLLLVDAAADPARSEIERTLFDRFESSPSPAVWLVLEHPADHDQPTGTAFWLNARTVNHHAHVRQGHKSDIARLSRWLTGQIQGIALSGGGARGFTHLGVVTAIYEHGYEIDLISGTSAGSMAGGLIARAKSPSKLMDGALKEIEAAGNPFVEFDIPIISLLRNKSMSDGLHNTFGDVDIEDNWIPFRVVATNLTESRRIVFDRGPVWLRVLAASSPPGIMPPVVENGQLLCDGGLVDNLPISVLLQANCKINFASYVGSAATASRSHSDVPTSWAFLLDRIFRRKRYTHMPTLLSTLLQCISVPAAAQLEDARKVADIFFEPDLSAFSVTDIGGAREMFKTGYLHAYAVLDERKGKSL